MFYKRDKRIKLVSACDESAVSDSSVNRISCLCSVGVDAFHRQGDNGGPLCLRFIHLSVSVHQL